MVNFELQPGGPLEQSFDSFADRCLAAGRLQRNVVIDRIFGKEIHYLVEVQTRPRFTEFADDIFGFVRHKASPPCVSDTLLARSAEPSPNPLPSVTLTSPLPQQSGRGTILSLPSFLFL